MHAALVIAAKDLRQRLRDRSAIIVAVIAPFGLAAIFSMLLGGTDGPLDLRYALVDLDRTELSTGFRDGPLAAIQGTGIATISLPDDRDAARAAIANGDVDAAVVIPAGFSDAVTSGEGAALEVIGDTDSGLGTDILRSLAESYTAQLEGVRLAVATTLPELESPSPELIAELAERATATEAPIATADVEIEARRMSATTYFASSMAIFFLFFTAQFGVLSLLSERREGTLARLVAAPIPPWAIVLGKALGSFLLGIGAMTVLVLASSLLLGAEWGNPLAVALLVLAAVIAAMGITALITTLARTEEQAGGWNSIVAVSLAILGGAFFDVSQGPAILGQVSRITPHAWFLEGIDILSAPGTSVLDVGLPLLALAAIGLVTGAAGMARAGALLVRR